MNVEEVLSHKKNGLFLVDTDCGQFLYEIEKKKLNRCYRRCVRAKDGKCPAQATIDKNPQRELVKLSSEHNHANEESGVMRRNAIRIMEENVVAMPGKSCREVYHEVLAATVSELRAQRPIEEIGTLLPALDNVRSALQRHRAKTRPALPRSLADIRLEGAFTRTNDDETFLIVDDTDSANNRIFGFCSDEALEILCESTTVHMDETFKVVPSLFRQLCSLHGRFKGVMMPLAYFLLPNKEEETYIRMFTLIRTHAATKNFVFRPTRFHLDFEKAVLKAIEELFPVAEVKGCVFHHTQALWRNVQRYGLTNSYRNDVNVKKFIKSLMALCLVPLEHLDEVWMQLDADSPSPHHEAYARLGLFKEYFIRTWDFPRALWNHYGNFGTRTTNHLEGWHNALNKRVKEAYCDIYKMIRHLNTEEHEFQLKRVLLNAGNPPKAMQKKYRDLNARLIRLTEQYQEEAITLIQYVNYVALNLHEHAPSPSTDDVV